MDRFSFVMVLLSIIVGLGVTELLSNVAYQIQQRAKSKPYWIHSVLVVLIFVAFLQQWWEMWSLHTQETWSFPVLLLMLGGPVCLYVISHLMFPDEIEGTDFKAIYFDDARILYILAALAVTLATLFRPVSFGMPLFVTDNLASFGFLLSFIVLAISKNRWIHGTIVPLMLIALLSDILIFNMSIS